MDVFKMSGIPFKPDFIKQLFKKSDVNDNGQITYLEFLVAIYKEDKRLGKYYRTL